MTPHQRLKGFTLVELVAVLVLLGIIGTVAFSRFSNVESFRATLLQDSLLVSQRLAQRAALSHHASSIQWRLSQPTTGQWRYAVLIDGSEAQADTLSSDAGVSYSVALAAGGTLSGTVASGGTLTLSYDTLGNFTQINNGSGAQTVNGSLQLSLSGSPLCVSLSGYAYEATCR